MRKLKIYLDTSVISHLTAEDTPDKMNDTISFWNMANKYNIYISDIGIQEIQRCPQPKLNILLDYLNELNYTIVSTNSEAEALADNYIAHGVLTQKSYDDCLHLALAAINDCDIIVSWNFKHMIRYKTIAGVRAVNALNGYLKPIDIIQPTVLLNEREV